jgi:hypothetical protein
MMMGFVIHRPSNLFKAIVVGFFYACIHVGIDQLTHFFFPVGKYCPPGIQMPTFLFGWFIVGLLYYLVLSLTDELYRFERGEKDGSSKRSP